MFVFYLKMLKSSRNMSTLQAFDFSANVAAKNLVHRRGLLGVAV